ncbi:unnamed protein product [Arabis nemorensis]|uniref:F-box domain-containing protein n=1 Tax=Arabis nemorensis TaxID=586526 RepID=A0A565C2J1_9BRAS|nr:unnamed protein product [Arabis nemorensis]
MASFFWPSSTSVVPPPRKKVEEMSNWSELPPELTFSIMLRLDKIEILENAQKVCTSWRRVSKEPSLWRKIDLRNPNWMDYDIEAICRHAVDRSEGGLVEIMLTNFVTDSLLTYIADRSSKLRSLSLVISSLLTDEGFVTAVAKLPLLEELKLEPYERDGDDDALAIAESMPQLRHLQLIWNKLTDTGLKAILDKCPHLEHLDLRKCSKIKLSGDLEVRCLKMLKVFRRPEDSTAAF